MTKKITYTDESLGDIEVVSDLLLSPAELAFREEGVKVTLRSQRPGKGTGFGLSLPSCASRSARNDPPLRAPDLGRLSPSR